MTPRSLGVGGRISVMIQTASSLVSLIRWLSLALVMIMMELMLDLTRARPRIGVSLE